MRSYISKQLTVFGRIVRRELAKELGQISKIDVVLEKQSEQLEALHKKIDELTAQNEQLLDLAIVNHESVAPARRALWDARKTLEYRRIFENKKPLITVRIATFNKGKTLVDVALKSVLAQTYQNFEVIVVGDHCTDDTADRVKKLNDPRITFINLPYRSRYHDKQLFRWMMSGTPGMNLGAYMAKGDWIAPLDDDDEFTPDHLEKLLELALKTKSEMVYGKLLQHRVEEGFTGEVWSDPPEYGLFSFQGAMYMKLMDNFFQYDQASWAVREPSDWNLCKRMLLAGVRMASTQDVVGHLYAVPVELKPKDY